MLLESRPKGLHYVFTAAAGHSFAFYVLVNHLVLWLLSEGVPRENASKTFGYYIAAAYVCAVLGGGLASFLGAHSVILLGVALYLCGLFALVLNAGHGVLVLGILALGSGLIKPNIVTLVSRMFPAKSPLVDGALARFYSAINVGAIAAAGLGGYISTRYSFRAAFITALIGELIVLLSLFLGRKAFSVTASESSLAPLIAPIESGTLPPDQPSVNWRSLGSLLLFLVFASLAFWPAYHQNNAGLNVWAEQFTNRVVFGFNIPPTWFAMINSLICIFCAVPVITWFAIGARRKWSSIAGYALMSLSFVLLCAVSYSGASAAEAKYSALWLVLSITFSSFSEVMISTIGLARVSEQAPRKWDSLFMSIWYCTVALGGWIAGQIGSSFSLIEGFWVFASLCCIAGAGQWVELRCAGRAPTAATAWLRTEEIA